jgi:predicted Zn-dependent protease with MMP-like domain
MTGWKHARAPSLAEFEALARETFAALPERFRAICGDVAIHVADFPDDEMLDSLGIEDAFDLTGLYEGVDVTSASVTSPHASGNHVHLFRRPILDEWAERGDVELGALVAHVLVHEIGHHFGLSDAQMHAIEEEAE